MIKVTDPSLIWESLNHCEKLSYLLQFGKMLLNESNWTSVEIAKMHLILSKLITAMINGGCDSWL